ncbi:hypothetical protein L602_000300001920 [Cupriavidus gilardii J11]|uniref:Uncharacterized protein n=1 Tax=Cupriavidus gilardii J11 TaxID=936133 RepID=A0A562BFL4_9BURK|nr:hypothetical protein L602_000300001920 [Cupriavidus gilardii J11]
MADAALKLQPACDTGLRCEAALACYEILQAQLQGVSSAANRAHDDAPFETHQVRAMMNALAPVFGFDAVADPFIVPLSPREQAEVERLQTRAGLADIASLMLATLADRYLDTLAALLGPDHPLSRGQTASPAEAAAAHELIEAHPALVGAFGPVNAALVLQAADDAHGNCIGFALNRDTSLLQWQLGQTLRSQGAMADVAPDVLARWSEPPLVEEGAPRRIELRRMGRLYWAADLGHEQIPRALQLADLGRLSIGGDFPPLAFLNLADGLLRQLPARERAAAAVPQLDHALMRLKTDDPRAAMALDTLWAHVRADAARCAGAERMLMDKAPVEGGCGRLPGGRGRARVDQGRHVLAADPGETPALERCVERRSALSTGRRGGER